MPLDNLRKIHLYLAIALLVSACSSKSNSNDAVVKALEESLENSNKAINMSSTTIMRSLEDKTQDPATLERASIWFSKAEQIVNLSTEASVYIEGLKKLKDINSEKAKELFIVLKKYKEDVLNVDSSIRYEFANSISALPYSIDSSENSEKKFGNKFFSTSNSLYTSAMLTKLQNSIKTIENKTLTYCHNKTTSHRIIDYFPSPIIGQSSKYINPGDYIEISAGIGSFTTFPNQKISIGGNIIPLNQNIIAIAKIKGSKISGKHIVPVKISFINPVTGKEEIHETTIEYTVTAPCN
jgi:hypothetical protein